MELFGSLKTIKNLLGAERDKIPVRFLIRAIIGSRANEPNRLQSFDPCIHIFNKRPDMRFHLGLFMQVAALRNSHTQGG